MTQPASTPRSWKPDTIAVEAGRPPRVPGAPVNPSIEMSSTFVGTGVPGSDSRLYARFTNASWDGFETAVAQLEGSSLPGVGFGSGMAAVSAVLDLVAMGGTVIMPRHSYLGSLGLARQSHSRGLFTLVTVDVADTAAVERALEAAAAGHTLIKSPAPLLLWLESPTNPMLEVADLPALIKAGQEAGALVVVDNTFATPLLQQPLGLGADLVVHSATKYLAGHSDLLMGIVLTNDAALRQDLVGVRGLGGAVPGSFETWLALRGLRTVALRVERSNASALELAGRLSAIDGVAVRYPGLPGDPGHARAAVQMSSFGAMLSLECPSAAVADAVVEAVQLFTPATSVGGVESLIERRRRNREESPTVPAGLLRLSIGIENVEDLWEDLSQALRVALSH